MQPSIWDASGGLIGIILAALIFGILTRPSRDRDALVRKQSRSLAGGSVYNLNLDPEVLARAFHNTVELLKAEVIVKP